MYSNSNRELRPVASSNRSLEDHLHPNDANSDSSYPELAEMQGFSIRRFVEEKVIYRIREDVCLDRLCP